MVITNFNDNQRPIKIIKKIINNKSIKYDTWLQRMTDFRVFFMTFVNNISLYVIHNNNNKNNNNNNNKNLLLSLDEK